MRARIALVSVLAVLGLASAACTPAQRAELAAQAETARAENAAEKAKPCVPRPKAVPAQRCAPTTTVPVVTTVPVATTVAPEDPTTTAPAPTTTAAPTTTLAPPAPQTGVPDLSLTGPRGALTPDSRTVLPPGAYSGRDFANVTPGGAGLYTFTDVDLDSFAAYNPGVRVVMDHVMVHSGLWFEGGSQSGWEIRWTEIDGGPLPAIRPKGAGSITVEDSWMFTHDSAMDPNIHVETMQGLDGAGGTFTRVGWSMQPRWADWGTPVTAIVTLDGPMTFTDNIFGYFDGANWSAGGGYYAIYAGTLSHFVRATIYHGGSGYWYPPEPSADRNVSPAYR